MDSQKHDFELLTQALRSAKIIQSVASIKSNNDIDNTSIDVITKKDKTRSKKLFLDPFSRWIHQRKGNLLQPKLTKN